MNNIKIFARVFLLLSTQNFKQKIIVLDINYIKLKISILRPVAKVGQSASLTTKNLPKFGKKRRKIGKKEEKMGKKREKIGKILSLCPS